MSELCEKVCRICKKPSGDLTYCSLHKTAIYKSNRESRKKRRFSGKCSYCNEKPRGDSQFCEKHHELRIEAQRKRYLKSKSDGLCVKCHNRLDRVGTQCAACCAKRINRSNTSQYRFNVAKNNATKRGIEFNVSYDEYCKVIINDCHYCKLSNAASKGGGLDRVDTTRPYDKDNIVSCCKECNVAKSNYFNETEMKIIGDAIRKVKLSRYISEI